VSAPLSAEVLRRIQDDFPPKKTSSRIDDNKISPKIQEILRLIGTVADDFRQSGSPGLSYVA